jgi:hypothetical protein
MSKKKNKDKFLTLVYENGYREPLYCFKQWWFPIDWLEGIDETCAPIQANLAKCFYERLDKKFNIVGVYVDDPDRYLMTTLNDILKYNNR